MHMPRHSTIHRTHLSYPSDDRPRCVNVYHDAVDCFCAGLPVSAYCTPCEQHLLRNNPHVVLNGVEYVLDYGEGVVFSHNTLGGVPVYEPIYVWKAWMELNYTAPRHVSEALYERLALSEEVAALESAAGWDPNP